MGYRPIEMSRAKKCRANDVNPFRGYYHHEINTRINFHLLPQALLFVINLKERGTGRIK